jgi:hypothetical protein
MLSVRGIYENGRVRLLESVPEQKRFKVIVTILEELEETAHPADFNVSKWSEIVQRVRNDPVHLEGYSRQLKKDIREFRDNFEFKHDMPGDK